MVDPKSFIVLIALTLAVSCKPMSDQSQLEAFHVDLISKTSGYIDTGVYIDSRPTTTFGELFSEEFKTKRWSGDELIRRESSGYDRGLHESYSPGGIFYFKAKALGKTLRPQGPSKIEILEGQPLSVEVEQYYNDIFADDTGTNTASGYTPTTPRAEDPDSAFTLKDTSLAFDSQTPLSEDQLFGDECQNLPRGEGAESAKNKGIKVIKSGKPLQEKDYSLCQMKETVEKSNIHKLGDTIFIMPIVPGANRNIHIKLYWPYADGHSVAEYEIKVSKLNGNFENYDESYSERHNLVPEYQDCDAISACQNKTDSIISSQIKTLCEQMNKIVNPIYSVRHLSQYSSLQASWKEKRLQLMDLSKRCQTFTAFRTSKRAQALRTVKFKIGGIHGLNIKQHQNTVEFVDADLNFAKALNAAFAGLPSLGVTGVQFYDLCDNRKVAGKGTTSRHAYCSAMDIFALEKNGKWHPVTTYKSTVKTDHDRWYRSIRDHFCQYFTVVLGPEYFNPRKRRHDHNDHFHIALDPLNETLYDRQMPQYADLPAWNKTTIALTSRHQIEEDHVHDDNHGHDPIDYQALFDEQGPTVNDSFSLTSKAVKKFCK